MNTPQKKGTVWFQPLTCIRQLGTTREKDGSVTYSFVAQVSRDLSPVRITMHVTTDSTLSIGAAFDAHVHVEDPQEDDHRIESMQLSLLDATPER